MNYQFAIYAQQTASAGRWAQDWDAETDAQSDDYIVYEGSREELLGYAAAADERAAQSGAVDRVARALDDVYWSRVARSLREAAEWYNDTYIHVCELCGKEFHALSCPDGEWVDADGDVVGYRLPIHEDDELNEGAENGTTCWRCGHEYMGDTICECARCGEVFAWAQSEHGELLAANDDVVGRRTPDGPICAACDAEE